MKIKKNNGFTEILELVDDNKKVAHSLKINVDIDTIAPRILDYQKRYADAEKKYNETGDIDTIYNAACDLFSLLLGEENTKVIKEWYGDEKLKMVNGISPFIAMVIFPKYTALEKARVKQYNAMARKIKRR